MTTKDSKDCGSKDSDTPRRKILRRVFYSILIFLAIILFIILLTWASIHPSKPRFILQDATVFNFNVSGNPPNLLTSSFQITLSSRNPNDKVGIYYDRLDIYASYRSQQITLTSSIQPTYQGHNDDNVWSPIIGGISVPVAPYNGYFLNQDHREGAIMMEIRIDGIVRWKVGSFVTGKYQIRVRCPAFINFGDRSVGVSVGNNAVKYTLITPCNVSV